MSAKQEVFSYLGYCGSSEVSHEDRCLVGQVLFIDDLVMYEGETFEALEEAFRQSVDEYLVFCKEQGRAPSKAYSGSFNIRIGTELHRVADKKAHLMGVTLNEFVRAAIQTAISPREIGGQLPYAAVPLQTAQLASTVALWIGPQDHDRFTPVSTEREIGPLEGHSSAKGQLNLMPAAITALQ